MFALLMIIYIYIISDINNIDDPKFKYCRSQYVLCLVKVSQVLVWLMLGIRKLVFVVLKMEFLIGIQGWFVLDNSAYDFLNLYSFIKK